VATLILWKLPESDITVMLPVTCMDCLRW